VISKAEKIKSTLQETKERRKTQRATVYQLKLQNLSQHKEGLLSRAFAEAKWLYNWLVSDTERLSLAVNKIDAVDVKVGKTFEERVLTVLGSQVKQEIADRLRDNLRALGKLKKNGHKVGALKPKKFINSIPLKQYGVTYKLDFARNRVRIQNLGTFRVLGLQQIPEKAEIANGVLVRKPSGYYLHVTCYIPREDSVRKHIGEAVGIDFGVNKKLTLSNGLQIRFELHETKRLKRLQRDISRCKNGSSNREKLRAKLRKEYEKINNRRKDVQNKVLAYLKQYKVVVYQDDFIKGWEALFGRQIHASGIGGLKSRLRNSLETPIEVARYERTTQECFQCGKVHRLSLSERMMECECGWESDRDVNAALVILRKGLGLEPKQAVGLDRSEITPAERETAARIFGSNPYILVSFLQ